MTGKRRFSASSQESNGTPPLATQTAEWPASSKAIEDAQYFLKECASKSSCTLLVPDKDADGLSGGLIIYRTLVALGHSEEALRVHFVTQGSNPHREQERQRLEAHGADYAIVVDQGSRPGSALVPGAKTLLVDHHLSDEFPDDTLVLSACKYEPVVTSATLAYLLCRPLHPSVVALCDYLCAMGTLGDLGTSFQFPPPFPQEDMKACFKKYIKKVINEAISLVNAPRRTATFDVESAWKALLASSGPSDIVNPRRSSPAQLALSKRLHEARLEVTAEVARCAHVAPAFSGDGRVALLRIDSAAQVHPLVATRWAGHLRSARLQAVIVANTGYAPGLTHFSCRVARCASGGPGPAAAGAAVDVIALLKDYAARVPGFAEAVGNDFARGHTQASGGIVTTEQFERLWEVMVASAPKDEESGEKSRKRRKKDSVQKNTLEGWVKRA
ncbi:uncharacterized protein PHACADRAFT_213194 [Phanerochaete carnosa HHB-10118-sp]|uniref:Uncharacterized protein n=1 Tax=Phanerochaete carnosa (strain HHB-10118-sp) TaxID=650164 RepID=K5WM58_PHACS|nr:uncharacterized protein PHACADRAFT_213194 [Phanerochaete carnosa HHB-10118-sp]EKM51352.1 hypothetical protein PHACADRAFT_213194 [Phanerochaete carnosa HHB-10118-sp]